MEEDLLVKLDIHENVKGFSIAPLLFIAFIENAFKYVGHEDQKQDRVEISLKKEDDRLLFRVYNTKETIIRKPILHKGIGIVNVKRRLELLYPGKYSLDISNTEKFYEVNLNLSMV
jgi:LytS/YehU family sensor histidine kinase